MWIKISISPQTWDEIRRHGHGETLPLRIRFFSQRIISQRLSRNIPSRDWESTHAFAGESRAQSPPAGFAKWRRNANVWDRLPQPVVLVIKEGILWHGKMLPRWSRNCLSVEVYNWSPWNCLWAKWIHKLLLPLIWKAPLVKIVYINWICIYIYDYKL